MGGITEKQLFEAFGLGEQVQEPAAPAPEASVEDMNKGEQVQELADPAEDPTQPAAGNETAAETPEEDPDDTETQPGKPQLTQQQRRENAARRRQQEQQEAINAAVASALKAEQDKNNAAIADIFQKAGLKNSITGQPITTLDQFNEWHEKYSQQKLERELKEGKLTQEGLSQVISRHPMIQQAERLIAEQKVETQRRQAENDKAIIEAELAKIAKRDPSIKTVQDLLTMPEAKAFREKVQRGYSFDDAHALVTQQRLEQARIDAAKQQAINNARGKNHLRTVTGTQSAGASAVPPDIMAAFRQFNPDATPAEIQAYYEKYQKN